MGDCESGYLGNLTCRVVRGIRLMGWGCVMGGVDWWRGAGLLRNVVYSRCVDGGLVIRVMCWGNTDDLGGGGDWTGCCTSQDRTLLQLADLH